MCLCNNRFNAAQLAIIAAVVMVIADIITLISSIAAFDEQQTSDESAKRDIENQISELQGKLSRYKKK
jgi:hypothetical protein